MSLPKSRAANSRKLVSAKSGGTTGAKSNTQRALVDADLPRVTALATLVSIFSFFYYAHHGALLFYGDAVAHINIARRVVDSQTPGLLQLGTVWLPLPHLLILPFVWVNALWQNGTCGSIPSMAAYVFATMGVFRLVRRMLGPKADAHSESSDRFSNQKLAALVGAWTAALVYAANPNLIYIQATAMTESLYLAFFIWSVVYLSEFGMGEFRSEIQDNSVVSPANSLTRCALCVAGAELTRYDGWFLGVVAALVVGVIGFRNWSDQSLRWRSLKFVAEVAVVPILWFVYNAAIYGNALAFANGPYSARAIEQRVGAPNPALHSGRAAVVYFLKAAQLNLANGNWGRFWLAAALLAGAILFLKFRQRMLALLLLWLPVPFYACSIAYGSVPVHVATWWPFVAFNARYGLQLLPMLSVSAGILMAGVVLLASGGRHSGKITALMMALIAASYASVWKTGAQCFLEAQKNWQVRSPMNSAIERVVTRLPDHSMYLMDLSEHVGIFEQAGIPLKQVINNENHRIWVRPSDPQGLWESALADPARYVDYVVAFDGDQVDQHVNRSGLSELIQFHSTSQAPGHLFATKKATNQSR
jgi:hypothetical protein